MGGVIGLLIVMVVIATAVGAPLGYFIYKYTSKNTKPFGEAEEHGDSPSLVNDLAESAIHFVKTKLAKK